MPAQPSLSIEGVVVSAAGAPVPGVTVMITTSDQPHPDIAAITDERGAFGFDGLAAGRYTFAAYRDGTEAGRAEVSIRRGDAGPVRIQID